MLNISAQSDYGILMISYLIKKKEYIPLSELIEQTKLPTRYMARIAATLTKNGILLSREGKVGGYKLSPDATKVTLFDYLKIFEGDLTLVKCQKDGYDCPLDGVCKHNTFLKTKLSNVLEKELKRYRLLDLFKS